MNAGDGRYQESLGRFLSVDDSSHRRRQKNGANYTPVVSTDGGVSYTDANTPAGGANLNAVAFSGATGVAVGDGGTILRITDSGATWTDQSGATTKNLESFVINGSTVSAVGAKNGASKTVVISTDGGANWAAPASVPAGGANLTKVAFVSPTVLIAVADKNGGGYTILRSVDGGANWTAPASVPAGNRSLSEIAISGNSVVSVGDKQAGTATIIRSTSGGDNWVDPTFFDATKKNLNRILFVDASTVIAVGDVDAGAYTMLRSSEAGDNWSTPSLPGGGANLNGLAVSGTFVIAVGRNEGIIGSTDGGANWSSQSSGGAGTVDLLDVAIINPVIAVGSGGETFLSGDQASSGSGSSWFEPAGGLWPPAPALQPAVPPLIWWDCYWASTRCKQQSVTCTSGRDAFRTSASRACLICAL